MADEPTTAAAPVDAPAPAVTSTEPETTETAATNGDSAAPKEQEDKAAEHVPTSDPATEAPAAGDAGDASAEPASASTPASASKDKKRKSTGGGVPEHKGKKLNKKKSMPNLNLDCKPGQHYWARLKGYPPWPAIICDESMLPEALLASRPVSTAGPDGSIREDFKEGGKNARERTFPIMFLSTNEFQWMNNTLLTPLSPEECKNPKGKMIKSLQDAYRIASEDHDLDFFKKILNQWQEEEIAARQAEAEWAEELARQEAEAAAAAANGTAEEAKPKKKASRKSKGAADEDVEMEDADAAPKSSKKRKKAEESDADAPKAKKTPKVMKLNAPKTPSDASAKKSSKPKKKVVTAPKVEDEDESKPQLTEEEKLAQREKAVLYLRHRLQKGFLSREQAPQESEMAGMHEFFTQLETYENLEPSIIRTTKIHKVLKAIVKLATVPKDDEFNFKKRSVALLDIWNKRMESEGDASAAPAATTEAKSEAPEEKSAPAEEATETSGTKETESVAPASAAQDTEMKDAEPTTEGAEEKVADEAAEKIEEKLEGKTDAVDALPSKPAESVSELAEAAKEDAKENGEAKIDEPAAATAVEGETATAAA